MQSLSDFGIVKCNIVCSSFTDRSGIEQTAIKREKRILCLGLQLKREVNAMIHAERHCDPPSMSAHRE